MTHRMINSAKYKLKPKQLYMILSQLHFNRLYLHIHFARVAFAVNLIDSVILPVHVDAVGWVEAVSDLRDTGVDAHSPHGRPYET